MRISDWSSDVCSSDRTLRLTGLHRREHARCIAILHRARQPRWWQLCPALAVIDPGPAAVLTDLIIEVTSEPQLRRIPNGRCVEPIGRASCREKVCPSVWISGVAVSLQTKTTHP